MSELMRTGLWGHVNVIITSDHGMAQCSTDRIIRLDDCLHPDNYSVVDLTPIAAIMPNRGVYTQTHTFVMSEKFVTGLRGEVG